MAKTIVYRTIPEPTAEETNRFWSKIAIGDKSDCWPWLAACNSDGYGATSIGGIQLRAHRVAFFIEFKRQPVLDCRHECDNPPCCNPYHLVEGTCQDNADDMVSRGRSLAGERHKQARIGESQVMEIRMKYINDESGTVKARIKNIANSMNIPKSTVAHVVYGYTWRHLGLPPLEMKLGTLKQCHPGAKLTQDEVIEIRQMYATGDFTQNALGILFNICQSHISAIVRGERWNNFKIL